MLAQVIEKIEIICLYRTNLCFKISGLGGGTLMNTSQELNMGLIPNHRVEELWASP